MASPRMIGAAARTRLEGPAEIRFGEGCDLLVDSQLHRRVVEGRERRIQIRKEGSLVVQLVRVGIESFVR